MLKNPLLQDKARSYTILALIAFFLVFTSSHESVLSHLASAHGDVQMYMDVAREMLSGKVLYADVFDHKGPWLYFAYVPAMLIDPWGNWGVFLLEAVHCAAWMCIIYAFCIKRGTENKVALVMTVAVAVVYTTSMCYMAGQTESLALPWLTYAFCAYLECRRENRSLTRFEAVVIGLGLGWCFWAKFTICIFYALIALFLVSHYMRSLCASKRMLGDIAIVLCAAIAASIPVAVYFLAVGNIALPIKDYLLANLAGGYMQSSEMSLIFKDSASALFPYAYIAFAVAAYVGIKRKVTIPSLPCAIWFVAVFVAEVMLGRAGWQFFAVMFVLMAPMAAAFSESLQATKLMQSKQLADKQITAVITTTLIAVALLINFFSVTVSMVQQGHTVVSDPAPMERTIAEVAEEIKPGSSLHICSMWDFGFRRMSRSHIAKPTLGTYQLQQGIERVYADTREVERDKSADYVLISDYVTKTWGFENAQGKVVLDGYEEIGSWDFSYAVTKADYGTLHLFKRAEG